MNEHHDKQAKAAVSAGASAEAYAPVADGKPQAGPGEKARQREVERKARAAKKLRENLLKRKQQVRARRAGEEDDTIGLPAAKTDESSS
ncbi:MULTISPECIES: hypothetical protein [Agrobacterium]|uniref:Uncharacterized protein n=2 Tax=Agrobacterium tumefaciens TaxID=358 RepID=A0A822UZV1_AGRTU|nr:hypothetical protein [Agrobacterium tumefaciens]AYM04423.1 hypothetical protein At1D1460_01810 [Agrobacterium tumefaciens]AYM80059.1 hypothetical protein At12D1_01720 [Agrobacterium tumefaciens]KWT89223.1 hypothetical protein ASB65_02155 [Agrobacterium tumefaciens str. B6]MBP2532696.1 hypothetical protein [Agrobacterium tumefaciens]MBP2569294.1 hypothetical protein [Agrobacterium tumefaciens]